MKKKRWQYICLFLFFTFVINYCFPCLSVQAELASTPVAYTETGRVSFTDITGHWAEKEIRSWTARELAGGYPDGTFRPDSPITRAEFLALVNRAFGYAEMVGEKLNSSASSVNPVTFHDVAATDWYAVEFAQAAAVGYLGGYPDGTAKPQNPITRQEVATVLARILPPHNDVQSAGTIAKFVDQDQIPAWSEAAIAAAVKGGYMSGYPDGSFQPNRPITRAEALAVLDRAVGMLYNRAGTYGPFQGTVVIEGNATISTPGVTLQNITITGTLYLTEGIGEGDVTLINVTVQGTTKIAGGGRDSIQLRNTTLGAVLVNVPSRKLVRVLAQGDTAVGILEARTPARLEEEELTGSGFTKVVVNNQQVLSQGTQAQVDTSQEGTGTQENTGSQETEPGITVELLGNFDNVEVQAASAQLALQRGSIANLNLASTAQEAQIKLTNQASINTMTADAPATVQGNGSLNMLEASVDGVVVEPGIIGGKTKKKKSNDAALKDLTIDGETVQGFAPDVLFYEIILSNETTAVPVVQATARHAKARVTVTQAIGLDSANNTATVLVTAENGSTQTYLISFVKATVSGIAIKTAPTKTEYVEGEPLELDGLVITLTRTDESTEDIAFAEFAAKGIITNPEHGTVLLPEKNKVTITHTASGNSVVQELTIIPTYSVTTVVNGGTADVMSDRPKAKAGDTVTINISNLQGGKKFKAISVTGASGEIITTEETEAGKTYTFTMPAEAVTVTIELEAIAVTGVSLNKTVLILEADAKPAATETLTATVEPDDAANKEVTWSSSDDTVATVEEGVVTAVGKGTAVITVTTVEGAHTATCTVYVVDPTPIIDDSCVLYLDGRYGTNGPSATETWCDLSGNGNDGILKNFAYNDASGWTGEGLRFDGVDDYVELGDINTLLANRSGLSFCFWIKRDSKDTTNGGIIGLGYDSARQLWVYYAHYSNVLVFSTQNLAGQEDRLLYRDFKPDNWYYCAGTWDGTTKRLYINGEEVETVAFTGQIHTGTSHNYIGLIQDFNYAGGIIRDIAIYNRTLSPEEIAQNYLATKNPGPLSPVDGAVLDLRGYDGTNDPPTAIWQDHSGNDNDGTLYNFTYETGSGWTGEALAFNGVEGNKDDYVDCGNDESLDITDNLTLEAWLKIGDYSEVSYTVICKAHAYRLNVRPEQRYAHFDLWVDNGEEGGTKKWNWTGAGSLPESGWIHLVGTYVNNTAQIYINGQSRGTTDNTNGNLNVSTKPLIIGQQRMITDETYQLPFVGEISDVRIYNKALTAAEVLRNYLAGRSIP